MSALLIVMLAVAVPPTPPARPSAGQTPRGPAASVTPDQVSDNGGARTTASDRTAEVDVPQSARLSRAATVTVSEVSSRADEHVLAVAPVGGIYRCDPASGRDRTDLCRRRIEARADQYARPNAAPVTPEARLLLIVDPGGKAARRQIGGNDVLNDPNSAVEQLAGALREQTSSADTTTRDRAGKVAETTGVPAIVPPMVVIRPR